MEHPVSEPEIDTDKIDEAALALMYLTLHDVNREFGYARAWKSFDWEVTDRLHEKGWIDNPANKTKSVVLTEEGLRRCEALFHKLFAKEGGAPA